MFISTDKTQLSRQQGDQSAWPVYMTIGNLDRNARRSHRPGMVLLGYIPIVYAEGDNRAFKYGDISPRHETHNKAWVGNFEYWDIG